MITDDIYGRTKDRIYKPSRKPILKVFDYDTSNLDPELKKLKYVMIDHTNPDNREWCLWNSSIARSQATITSATIFGDGLRVRCSNPEAKRIIDGWNKEINVNGKSIEDYYDSTWLDEICHANSYWRIENIKDLAYKLDIQRLDPKTITKLKDPKYAWTLLLQELGNYKAYRSKLSFYANANKNDIYQHNIYPRRGKVIRIQDEPTVILRTSFFIKPPISGVAQYIAYKKFILYFMRKYSQRLWTPFILLLAGDPKTNYYYDDPQDMQDAMADLAEIIPDMVSFGGAAIPGNTIVHELGKGSARSSEVFVHYMEALDKQIMIGIFSSMGLREASGVELATSRTLMEGHNQFLQGMRRRYAIGLTRFYVKALLPAHGIKVPMNDIEIDYSPLRTDSAEAIMRAVEIGVNTGMFKDRNEVRKAGQVLYPWMEQVSSGENKKLEFPVKSNKSIDRIMEYAKRTL